MRSDEEQIRELVATWFQASKAGDTETVLNLMTDDVVFLQPGRDPMRRPEFIAALHAQAGGAAPKMDGASDIQEITICGEWAFMWSRLTVIVHPQDGSKDLKRTGHTLTVLRKIHDKWLICRDANLLGPAEPVE